LVPELYGPIYQGLFADICPLLPAPHFPIVIYSAQIAWPLQSIAYSLPSPFSGVRFAGSTYASCLSALYQGFPVGIIPVMCKFSLFLMIQTVSITLDIPILCYSTLLEHKYTATA
jgi:hypothetical protein